MSAYLELQRVGGFTRDTPATAELLYRTVAAVARRRGYRPPPGSSWEEFVTATTHDFLTGPRGLDRVTALYLRATDDASLQRLLWTAVENHFRDEIRRTDRGALQRKLAQLVADDATALVAVAAATTAWALPHLADAPLWGGDEQDLVAAAWSVDDVRVVRWRSTTRRSPMAEDSSLVRVLTAVIERAGAPVPVSVMVRVLEQRFALAAPTRVVELDDEPASAAAGWDPATEVTARLVAIEVFDQLSDRERVALAHFDEGARDLGVRLGVSKSTAATVKHRVEEVLNATLRHDDDDLDAVWGQLRELAAAYAADWTPPVGPPSTSG